MSTRARALPGTQWRAALLLLAFLALVGAYLRIQAVRIAERLMRTQPAEVLRDPVLLRKAVYLGRPLYQKHCAGCHGAAFEGDRARGVPDLAGDAWLYGNDPVGVERTILYGIRSGHPKSRNVTDMPALVRSGQITEDDARDLVEYLESLAGMPYDRVMAQRGHSIFYDKGNCFDCHATDAGGTSDYGAPGLTGPVWLYGGDRKTLYRSLLDGRHGMCPAWVDKLTPVQIRALTLYFVSAPRAAVARH